MGSGTDQSPEAETGLVTVRLWAAAKATAGIGTLEVPVSGPVPLSGLIERVLAGRPDRLGPVLAGCSVLVGDQPVSTLDPADVLVPIGATVEFLPPFAGG